MSESQEDQLSRTGGNEADVEATIPSLERLRDRILRASDEIVRLRTTNAELAERIRVLEETHVGASLGSGALISIDEDPELLREKVGSFIRTIDRYLEEIEDLDEDG